FFIAAPIFLSAQNAANPERNDTTQASNYILLDIADQITEDDYNKLLDSLKRYHTTDYLELRMAHTKTDSYDPYSTEASIMFNKANALLAKGKYEKGLAIIEDILDNNYVNLKAHLWASLIYYELQDSVKGQYHKNIYDGLFESIILNGDGRGTKTAYIVIDINEEFDILEAYNLENASQNSIESDGHSFDRIEVNEKDKKEVINIYFNIDLPIAYLEKRRTD
ncbi:MAG TPA: DUF4919 domain-containing protein, partial [Ignavibacteriales bacterium]|nr:DUF4919 domain-containing protein [Ignavibacteriales bacterium]